MGVDIHAFDYLLKFRRSDAGAALTLGRQGFHIARGSRQWEIAEQLISAVDPNARLADIQGDERYSENFLKFLGCRSVLSIDYSQFEGADIIYDLNKPVPRGLHQRFDIIFDGGTMEHVFNVPMVLDSVKKMLRPGGIFITINAANHQLGHGFYQFSPELFWRVFGEDPNFTIEDMRLVQVNGSLNATILSDPGSTRQEIGPTATPTYIMCAARKGDSTAPSETLFYQGDYAARWSS
jgi:SAM-dependent methyltransferase